MALQGYIAVHRKILQSSVFEDAELLKMWLWCLLRANHKDTEVVHGQQVISLKRGQFITGRFTGAKELRLTTMKYRKRLELLSKLKQISLKTTNKYTIITVINYSLYQDDKKKVTNKQPTNNQQITTDKNVKNEKEIGETSSPQLKDNSNTMGWNIPNDNESDLPSIGDDGKIEETDAERIKKENEKVVSLMEWGEKVRGKKFLDKPTQIKHIKLLKAQNISLTKIKDTFVELVHSDYWKAQDRLPDFKTVVSTLKNER